MLEDGYETAFYEIADMLGIPARAHSPKHVWEHEMRPRLQKALQHDGAAALPGNAKQEDRG